MDKLTDKDKELVKRQLKAKTPPAIIAGMFRGTLTMKGNERIVEEIAKEENLQLNNKDQSGVDEPSENDRFK